MELSNDEVDDSTLFSLDESLAIPRSNQTAVSITISWLIFLPDIAAWPKYDNASAAQEA
jgi:hypothetical protein